LCIVLVQSTSSSAPAAFQPGRLGGEDVAGAVPLAGDLQGLDLGEVQRGEHDPGGVQARRAGPGQPSLASR
jgi:hypothetical protein